VLGQVPCYNEEQPVESVEIGDLSIGTYDVAVDYCNQAAKLKDFDGPPVRSLTTPWLRSDRGLFHIHIAVVGPISKQPQGYHPLRRVEADRILEAIADAVKTLQEKLA